MFRCQCCNQISEPKEKQIPIIMQTRVRHYFNESGKISIGSEIVRVMKVKASCAELTQYHGNSAI